MNFLLLLMKSEIRFDDKTQPHLNISWSRTSTVDYEEDQQKPKGNQPCLLFALSSPFSSWIQFMTRKARRLRRNFLNPFLWTLAEIDSVEKTQGKPTLPLFDELSISLSRMTKIWGSTTIGGQTIVERRKNKFEIEENFVLSLTVEQVLSW